MQTVGRGDRPGKGRYQEFTQCDADIIGSDSTLCELDLITLFHEVLSELGVLGYEIVLNDRRLLNGLARAWGIEEQFQDFTVALINGTRLAMMVFERSWMNAVSLQPPLTALCSCLNCCPRPILLSGSTG